VWSTGAHRSTVARGVRAGRLRPVGPRLYTSNLTDDLADVVARHRYDIVAGYFPGAVIVDRSAANGGVPVGGELHIDHSRQTELQLPGLLIRPRPGPGPLPGDMPFVNGLSISSPARVLLDNARESRGRAGRGRRTLDRPELEEYLETLCQRQGTEWLIGVRKQIDELAGTAGMTAEARVVGTLIGAILGTRDASVTSPRLRARIAGRPFDSQRLELFTTLRDRLLEWSPKPRVVADATAPRHRYLPFFEAYFSNFIEGTEFTIDEAVRIALRGEVPPTRPADAHDIIGTYEIVSDATEMTRVPRTGDEVLSLLRERHRRLLAGRPDKRPGEFKERANQAGATQFVAPDLVPGTLEQGFRIARPLADPFARAVFLLFLVSEVHPFDDGNGRIARIMMNAELVAAGEQRIVVPTVYRNNYLQSLRALTHNRRPDPLIRTLDFAQQYTASVDFSSIEQARSTLQITHALDDPSVADASGIRLTLPSRTDLPTAVATLALDDEHEVDL
jgi:fido (protein-threonine AMPylation protein)